MSEPLHHGSRQSCKPSQAHSPLKHGTANKTPQALSHISSHPKENYIMQPQKLLIFRFNSILIHLPPQPLYSKHAHARTQNTGYLSSQKTPAAGIPTRASIIPKLKSEWFTSQRDAILQERRSMQLSK
ncbi:hypothetical protein IQ07DRAFT_149615 [Pyrenochaeta sp. DS3sAY3a]|nr:hypothetical protein IQ07DRAFT_149615 [Pyrenochaeta sp. DS3sAY3a]